MPVRNSISAHPPNTPKNEITESTESFNRKLKKILCILLEDSDDEEWEEFLNEEFS